MREFIFVPASNLDTAAAEMARPGAAAIGGGTDLMQLLKDGVETPDRLVDLETLLDPKITEQNGGLRIGAAARMADVAADPRVHRSWPVVSQALLLSASPQVRNMATMGGNLLQRTRCRYFRDTGFARCNKRSPGSGCGAMDGDNRDLAILGTSKSCIANYPGDLAVALVAMDAELELQGPQGERRLPVANLHRLPEDRPDLETNLLAGEVITAINLPPPPKGAKSTYVKVRDRTSFAFSLASCAAALSIAGGQVRSARIAVGGVASKPWRLEAVEAALVGKRPSPDLFAQAAAHAGAGAVPQSRNGYKLALLQRTVTRALTLVAV
jgi:xanthine dehydrogenase YagS FAD-binding subunit